MNSIAGRYTDRFALFGDQLVNGNITKHGAGNIFCTFGPDIDDLVIAFAIGDQPFGILLLNVLDLIGSNADPCFLRIGNFHVVKTDGNTGKG